MKHVRNYIEEQYGEAICGCRKRRRPEQIRRFRMRMKLFVRQILTRTPAAVKESLTQRSVPSISADLETFSCKPHEACEI